MSFKSRIGSAAQKIVTRFTGLDANQQGYLTALVQHWDDNVDAAGTHINIHSGMRLDVVYTSIKRVADAVAMTPSPVYQYDATDTRSVNKALSHPVYRVLNTQAMPDLSSYDWKHVSITHLLGWGNCYSLIERDNAGRVIGLNPMYPDDVKLDYRDPRTGNLVYQWKNNEGQLFYFQSPDIFHVRWNSEDGVHGISPIYKLRKLMGRTAAREEYQNRFYMNGAMMGGVISVAGSLTDDQMKRSRDSFNEFYRGPKNAGKILLLEGGGKYDGLGVAPRDAQFIETAKLDAAKIAAIYGVPMQFVNETESTNKSTAEQLFREFLSLGLNTVFSNFEQQINMKLFTTVEQASYYVEFLRESLIQADFAALIAGLKDEVTGSMLTPNEARAKINMNPLPGGDVLMAPVNYVPLAQLGQTTAFQPKPGAPAPAPEQQKSIRSADPVKKKNNRKQIIKSQQVVLQDAFERVHKREQQDISKLVKKNLRSNTSFNDDVSAFYAPGSDFNNYFSKTMKPIVNSTSSSVGDDVSNQIDGDVGDGDQFASDYLDGMTFRYTSSSQRQLQSVLADLPEGDDASDAVDERLTQWGSGTSDDNPTRAEKESGNEATRMVNAMARSFMVAGGVQNLVWSGGDCPICAPLDGTTVSSDENFLDKGDDSGNGYTAETDIAHPPLHAGCNCTIDPA